MTLTPAEPMRYEDACCADPRGGGCPHLLDDHHAGNGPCQVRGCTCLRLHAHSDTCVHYQQPQE